MGNLCPWCVKKDTSSLVSNDHLTHSSGVLPSQFPVNVDDRTPFVALIVAEIFSMNLTWILDFWTNPIITGVDQCFTAMVNHLHYSHRLYHNHWVVGWKRVQVRRWRGFVLTNVSLCHSGASKETAENKMMTIVEEVFPKLIDVCGHSSTVHVSSTGSNSHLRQIVHQSLSSSGLPILPDVGLLNLPSLLSDRSISSDTCYHVARTAEELSRLFTDEIKITHRENLVAIFE
jgi:hypothetical protein